MTIRKYSEVNNKKMLHIKICRMSQNYIYRENIASKMLIRENVRLKLISWEKNHQIKSRKVERRNNKEQKLIKEKNKHRT